MRVYETRSVLLGRSSGFKIAWCRFFWELMEEERRRAALWAMTNRCWVPGVELVATSCGWARHVRESHWPGPFTKRVWPRMYRHGKLRALARAFPAPLTTASQALCSGC